MRVLWERIRFSQDLSFPEIRWMCVGYRLFFVSDHHRLKSGEGVVVLEAIGLCLCILGFSHIFAIVENRSSLFSEFLALNNVLIFEFTFESEMILIAL
jgi:hypothetical protein